MKIKIREEINKRELGKKKKQDKTLFFWDH